MTTSTNLPAGVSQNTFNQAVSEYAAIVGNDNVFVADESMSPYMKAYIPVDEKLYAPSGAVSVSSVAQIQAVLKVSHKYGIPLWPISTGRNFGYGEALPAVPGQLLLDLRKMNKIIEVDPVLGTALVEPGVTYAQLHAYIKEHNFPLWLSVPGPGPLVGPLGQTLIRGEPVSTEQTCAPAPVHRRRRGHYADLLAVGRVTPARHALRSSPGGARHRTRTPG